MTNGGTFVINGGERVIVSQIVRSPGMYYGHEVDKADQHTYTTTVIPYRGAWLEYETDNQGVFYVRIDKKPEAAHYLPDPGHGWDTDAKIKELFGEDPPHQRHPGEGHLQDPGGEPPGDLPPPAPRRASHSGKCRGLYGHPVL